MRLIKSFLLFFILIVPFISKTQEVPQDINTAGIYDFIDELANLQLIDLPSFAKPYPRNWIAKQLKAVDADQLNSRQKAELAFYLKDFNKELEKNGTYLKRRDLYYYQDSLFTITINPIIGYEYAQNDSNKSYIRRTIGASIFGSIGPNWAFYASLRDNTESFSIDGPSNLNNNPGPVYKGSGDYSEMRAGISYSWSWGSIHFQKDQFTWGNHYFGANIISNRAPSFFRTALSLRPVEWLKFDYYHAWLSSRVRDTSRTYSAGANNRAIDVQKFIAANALGIRPFKRLWITLGNSIVYSDNLQPVFFIPVLFYKSVDHTVYAGSGNYGGQNTQLFFDISSRNIKNLHLFSSLYVDEVSFERMWSKSKHSNFFSLVTGFKWSNIANKNLSIAASYTRTNPITYKHFVNTTTYASNNYTLGHYLGDNAEQLETEIGFKPFPKFNLIAGFQHSRKGLDNNYQATEESAWGLPFLKKETWKMNTLYFESSYELINDLFLSARFIKSTAEGSNNLVYTSPFFQGQKDTFWFTVNYGF